MQFEDQQGDHDGKHPVAKGFDPAEPAEQEIRETLELQQADEREAVQRVVALGEGFLHPFANLLVLDAHRAALGEYVEVLQRRVEAQRQKKRVPRPRPPVRTGQGRQHRDPLDVLSLLRHGRGERRPQAESRDGDVGVAGLQLVVLPQRKLVPVTPRRPLDRVKTALMTGQYRAVHVVAGLVDGFRQINKLQRATRHAVQEQHRFRAVAALEAELPAHAKALAKS